MQRTNIEYLTHTWNPIAMRCTGVSEGCRNCWHIRMADRLAGNKAIKEAERKSYEGGFFALREKELMAPLATGSRKVIGVQFMGDLFHPQICFGETGWIDSILTIAALCQEHTFILLTKRPDNMAGYYDEDALSVDRVSHEVGRLSAEHGWCSELEEWPITNVWHGLTVCNQEEWDRKAVDFLRVPGKKFLSLEPLLGSINLGVYGHRMGSPSGSIRGVIDQVILGGETGAGARPMHPDWVRSVRDQCAASGVSFFFKQWGYWQPVNQRDYVIDDETVKSPYKFLDPRTLVYRVGRKRAGRLLDDHEWDELSWRKPLDIPKRLGYSSSNKKRRSTHEQKKNLDRVRHGQERREREV